jgi:hypothetical protein
VLRLAPLAYAKVGADSAFALQHQQRLVIVVSVPAKLGQPLQQLFP